MFNFFKNTAKGSEKGFGDSSYDTNDPSSLGTSEPLSYKDCENIYLNHFLGRKIATGLVNFTLSAERKIDFKDFPKDCIDRFCEIQDYYNINQVVKNSCTYTRIWGMSGLFVACNEVPASRALTYDDLQNHKIAFNLQDPLTLSGLQIGTDPTKTDYQRVNRLQVGGQDCHPARCYVGFNDLRFYLRWTPSTFSYGSASIYQNIRPLFNSINRCVIALERMATKGSALIYKGRDGSVMNSMSIHAMQKSIQLIRDLENDGICAIDKDAQIEFFNMQGTDAVEAIINKINELLLMGVTDTPAQLLLDKELSRGFANGGEDMKLLIMAVDNFRRDYLIPLYRFIDKHLLYLAFTPSFLAHLKEKYSSDFAQDSLVTLREKLINAFSFEWGELYPEPESTKIETQQRKIDNLLKLKELGANSADLETILNADETLFNTQITLENTPILPADDNEEYAFE